MLLVPDKKKTATLILAKMKPDYVQKIGERSSDKPMEPSMEDDMGNPKEIAAKAVLKAIESKDAKKLASAFSEMVAMCSGYEESYSESED
jgi:hypothetical protein